MTTVNVRSIDALEELQTGLIRYADQAQVTLDAVQREVQRTLDWLDERVRHWQNEVRRSQEEMQRARAAYERCMASGDREHPPSCGHFEAAVYEARRRLAQAEADLRMAAEARKAVLAEVDVYQREASRLRALVQNDTPKAVETLRYKVTVLRSYTGGISAGGVVAGAVAFGAGLAAGTAVGVLHETDNMSVDSLQSSASVGDDADSMLQPGPYAKEFIPATDSGKQFSEIVREQIDKIGYTHGCHSCGSTDPGTKSRHFIPDHQPPSALRKPGQLQKLYPHCLACSRSQGGQVRHAH